MTAPSSVAATVQGLQEKLKKATPLPWEYRMNEDDPHDDDARIVCINEKEDNGFGEIRICAEFDQSDHDAELIVAAVNALPLLLSACAGASAPQGWQPIETAPKDGTQVLLYRPKEQVANRIRVRAARDWCGPACCPQAEPTHWMPLPAAPPLAQAASVGGGGTTVGEE